MRSAGAINAVSQLHGEVTRSMWASIWGDAAETGRRIGAVTNGVHVPTWIASDLANLFATYLGADWYERHDEPALWDGVLAIPDQELWAVRRALKQYLFTFIRERARQRWMEEHVGIPRVVAAGTLLEPDALTIGFARRFTGYKRPELVFQDPERLARILNAGGRPVQLIFAGKSHPADDIGKHHLQRVYRRALDPLFGGRIAFVDDYDLHVAHFLVQGCDVWLNTPRKPLEASGTSGMKAALNGVPHLSIGDGWWAEGLQRRQRMGHRRRRHRRQLRRRRRGGRERAVSAARRRSRAGVLRTRSVRRAPPLGRDGQGSDPLGRAALLRAADGQGVLGADVRARGGEKSGSKEVRKSGSKEVRKSERRLPHFLTSSLPDILRPCH